MSASNAFENAVLLLYFNATAWTNVADNAASSPITNWQLSAHTSDPGEAGNQTTNESAYTSYARVAVARSGGGFTVSGASCTLAALTSFPAATGGSETITHFGIGTASTSTGILHVSGTATPNIVVAAPTQPQLTTATAITCD
jgi:hypothetical protein